MAASSLTPTSDIHSSCSSPAASLGQLHHGLQEELAPGQHGADTLPPKRPAPAPREQAQQDAVRGSLEAFREEHSPGTSPAGKEVSWVCHSVCHSPDSRPRQLSTNGVCVGADGRRASWRQGPREEGQAAGSGSRLTGQLNSTLAVSWREKAPPIHMDGGWAGRRKEGSSSQHKPIIPSSEAPTFPWPAHSIRQITEDRPHSYFTWAHLVWAYHIACGVLGFRELYYTSPCHDLEPL